MTRFQISVISITKCAKQKVEQPDKSAAKFVPILYRKSRKRAEHLDIFFHLDMVVMTSPDLNSLELLAFKKKDGEKMLRDLADPFQHYAVVLHPLSNHTLLQDPVEEEIFEDILKDTFSIDFLYNSCYAAFQPIQ